MHFSFLSEDKIIIFIHIPKSAGTTLRNQFLKFDEKKFYNKRILKSYGTSGFEKIKIHYDFINLSDEIYEEIIKNREKYFIFSVVRNPWDRLVSFYKHALRNIESFVSCFYQENYNNLDELKKESLKLLYNSKKNLTFKEFLEYYEKYYYYETAEYLKITLKQQISWLRRKDTNCLITDKIYKFENLQELKEDMKMMFSIDININEKLNASVHDHYSKYYDTNLKKLISERFKEDIEYFNYKFESE